MKPGDRESVRHRTVLPRFRDAFAGVAEAYRDEPNLRFHLFAAVSVAVAGYAVRLEGWETGYLALTICVVLLAELVNTALERAVDLAAGGQRHPLAAQAKQAAAGAVLLTSLHAVFAALFLFVLRRDLAETAQAVWTALAAKQWLALLPIAAAVLGLTGGRAPSGDR